MSATIYRDPRDLYLRALRRTVRTAEGCWMFTGSVNSRGYGSICSGRKSKSVLAHRLAYIATHGPIPAGLTIDHGCHDSTACQLGNECPHRRCINPAHLRVMTSGDNTRRRWARTFGRIDLTDTA